MASRDIKDAHLYLQMRWPLLKKMYEDDHPGCEVKLTCTHRDVAEQQELYAQGRTKPGSIVTNIDGVRRMSKHNYSPSLAFDVGVFDRATGKYQVHESWYDFQKYASKLQLQWGGSWISFKDRPHFEMPKVVKI